MVLAERIVANTWRLCRGYRFEVEVYKGFPAREESYNMVHEDGKTGTEFLGDRTSFGL